MDALTSVTVNWTTPPIPSSHSFVDVNLSNVTLNVPPGSKPAYQSADVWKYFGTIVEKQ
jgi:hypothetical protein